MSHFLTIIEHEDGTRDYELEHDPECEEKTYESCANPDHVGIPFYYRDIFFEEDHSFSPTECEMQSYTYYECGVAVELEAVGLDALDGEGGRTLEPGRYEVKFYAHQVGGYEYPNEWETGLEVIDGPIV